MTVIELVQYKLRKDAKEENFLKSLNPVLKNFLEKQPGFLKPWEIYKSEDGTWTEIVRWETMKNAKDAADPNIHEPCKEFFGFMDKSTIKLTHLEEKQIFE